ncbi:muramidase [Mesorhizobium sp. NBSH29]|uniref:glycoside hydrolase family 25 protein n=1 Tax=Mesorhizobium sp. NBSH29 TaxID=2654249 RepID=UPI0018964291|nr:GH25 family lysozyme [Mesorhizobium sp. NBSH29]QPC86993.1 muramidase [Mesorhizobium sp. NBSH29]
MAHISSPDQLRWSNRPRRAHKKQFVNHVSHRVNFGSLDGVRLLLRRLKWRVISRLVVGICASILATAPGWGSEFIAPWFKPNHALVIDAYEYNEIDWEKLSTNKRIAGYINKASDGLSPPYACSGAELEVKLCKALWKRHAVARELFQTRRMLAKSLGLKWGAYHLARPGNPIDQANNFIDFANPGPDDLMAIDIEDNDPKKWMSLEDAEEFVRHIQRRTGRFPVLYTNGSTAKHIADNRERYRLLSRLPLWYARYTDAIGVHFPLGYWRGYALWQFSSQANCNQHRCPYRIHGAPDDIDVNVAAVSVEALRTAWPYGNLIDVQPDRMASVPVPLTRAEADAGHLPLAYAPVEKARAAVALANAFEVGGNQYPLRAATSVGQGRTLIQAVEFYRTIAYYADFVAEKMGNLTRLARAQTVDDTITSSVHTEREKR